MKGKFYIMLKKIFMRLKLLLFQMIVHYFLQLSQVFFFGIYRKNLEKTANIFRNEEYFVSYKTNWVYLSMYTKEGHLVTLRPLKRLQMRQCRVIGTWSAEGAKKAKMRLAQIQPIANLNQLCVTWNLQNA